MGEKMNELDKFDKYKAYHATLTQKQKDWISHKCNWEQMSRWAVCIEYKDYIDSLEAPHDPA